MQRTSLLLLAWLAVSCQSDNFFTREVPRLDGWSETRLIERFGSPARVHTSTVEQFAHSPPGPWGPPTPLVLSMYPTNVEANLKVQIKSLSWQHGRIMLTVWLREKQEHWITFYAEEWNMDVIP